VRARYLEETLDRSSVKKGEAEVLGEDGLLKSLTGQPKIIYAMLIVSIISGFIMRMSWSFLSIYVYNVWA